jgi:hypothetical protein
MFRLIANVSVALAAGLTSCRDSTAPVAPCHGAIDVTVSLAPQPRFSWSPACGISLLWVATAPVSAGDVETVVWSFRVPERTPIGPQIRYGVLPKGADGSPAPPLVPGREYIVRAMYTVGEDAAVASGSARFTPR